MYAQKSLSPAVRRQTAILRPAGQNYSSAKRESKSNSTREHAAFCFATLAIELFAAPRSERFVFRSARARNKLGGWPAFCFCGQKRTMAERSPAAAAAAGCGCCCFCKCVVSHKTRKSKTTNLTLLVTFEIDLSRSLSLARTRFGASNFRGQFAIVLEKKKEVLEMKQQSEILHLFQRISRIDAILVVVSVIFCKSVFMRERE